jgi:hypothetical protein
MVYALPSSETIENIRLFSVAFERNDQGDVLPDGFFSGVPKYPLRAPIPTRNHAIKVLADNGIIGGGDNGSQQTRYFFCSLRLVHIGWRRPIRPKVLCSICESTWHFLLALLFQLEEQLAQCY